MSDKQLLFSFSGSSAQASINADRLIGRVKRVIESKVGWHIFDQLRHNISLEPGDFGDVRIAVRIYLEGRQYGIGVNISDQSDYDEIDHCIDRLAVSVCNTYHTKALDVFSRPAYVYPIEL